MRLIGALLFVVALDLFGGEGEAVAMPTSREDQLPGERGAVELFELFASGVGVGGEDRVDDFFARDLSLIEQLADAASRAADRLREVEIARDHVHDIPVVNDLSGVLAERVERQRARGFDADAPPLAVNHAAITIAYDLEQRLARLGALR